MNFDLTNLKNLGIDNFSGGGMAVLDNVRAGYEYKENQRTDKVNSLKVTVVLPSNHYEKLTVTVADPVDRLSAVLEKAPIGTPVLVKFDNFTARVYRNREGKMDVSAKADSVQVVDNDDDLIVV